VAAPPPIFRSSHSRRARRRDAIRRRRAWIAVAAFEVVLALLTIAVVIAVADLVLR
jgi:hypothetical protein